MKMEHTQINNEPVLNIEEIINFEVFKNIKNIPAY